MSRSRQFPAVFDIEITKLVATGEGLGHFTFQVGEEKAPQDRAIPVFVPGVLPGERVRVRIAKKNRRFLHALPEEILTPSPLRREPRDSTHLSTSPWQILPEPEQQAEKLRLTLANFQQIAHALPLPTAGFTASPLSFGYRNKLEFGFATDSSGRLHLSFNQRYRFDRKLLAEDGSALGHPAMNSVALAILAELRRRQVPAAHLKNLLVRASFDSGKVIAALFVHDPEFDPIELQHPDLADLQIFFSDPVRSVAVQTKLLSGPAELKLTEKLAGTRLDYGLANFFQVNPPAAAQLIERLREQVRPGGILLDLYAGVGTLGLSLAGSFDELRILELDAVAVEFARANAARLGVAPSSILSSAAEAADLPALLVGCGTVIVDPPRAGLDPRVVAALLESGPQQLVYVSCNPATQARDFALLAEKYSARHFELFDFYPQTPHVESLIIFERS